ncbi:acyltransferase family protein [Nonomuraea sp. NPDC049309]|uniref:acyltransferase family protein n=1 Tax=Nonomuraea sp. NPDC049309 TaxID=3364350 RepID=UPI003715EEB0
MPEETFWSESTDPHGVAPGELTQPQPAVTPDDPAPEPRPRGIGPEAGRSHARDAESGRSRSNGRHAEAGHPYSDDHGSDGRPHAGGHRSDAGGLHADGRPTADGRGPVAAGRDADAASARSGERGADAVHPYFGSAASDAADSNGRRSDAGHAFSRGRHAEDDRPSGDVLDAEDPPFRSRPPEGSRQPAAHGRGAENGRPVGNGRGAEPGRLVAGGRRSEAGQPVSRDRRAEGGAQRSPAHGRSPEAGEARPQGRGRAPEVGEARQDRRLAAEAADVRSQGRGRAAEAGDARAQARAAAPEGRRARRAAEEPVARVATQEPGQPAERQAASGGQRHKGAQDAAAGTGTRTQDRPEPQPQAERPKRKRDPFLDNVKFLLIALVPIGHSLVPTLSAHSARAAYIFIYTFHMPLFVVISGFLSRNFWNSNAKTNKLVDTFLIPYVIVEVGYAALRFALGHKWSLTIIDPAWLNWYLLALLFWRLSTPVWKRMRYPVPVAIAIYLFAGFSQISGDFSMDRFFGLLPFFVIGLVMQPEHFDMLNRMWIKVVAVFTILGAAAVAILIAPKAPLGPFYYKNSYHDLHVSWWMGLGVRTGLLICALAMCFAILALVPRKETWYTDLGTRTLYCYLLHGVPVLIAKDMGWLSVPWLYGPLGVLAIASSGFLLAIILCLPQTRTLFKWMLEPRLTWLYRRPSRS